MTNIGTAIRIASQVHEGQVDKGNTPYILHPLAVMAKVEAGYAGDFRKTELLCVAVLHDVFEDYKDGAWGPRNKGGLAKLQDEVGQTLGLVVVEAVGALTKHPRAFPETYDEYIERVGQNWMARIVKIADLSHNLDTTRLPSGKIAEQDFSRWDKYHRALVRLSKDD